MSVMITTLLMLWFVEFTSRVHVFPMPVSHVGSYRIAEQSAEKTILEIPSVANLLKGFQTNNKQRDILKNATPQNVQFKDRSRNNRLNFVLAVKLRDTLKALGDLCGNSSICRVLLKGGNPTPNVHFKDSGNSAKGSFKISSGNVNGGGDYSVSPHSVDLGINLKIGIKKEEPSPSAAVTTQQPQTLSGASTGRNKAVTDTSRPTVPYSIPTFPTLATTIKNQTPNPTSWSPRPSGTSGQNRPIGGIPTNNTTLPPTTHTSHVTNPTQNAARPTQQPSGFVLTTPKMCQVPCNTPRPSGLALPFTGTTQQTTFHASTTVPSSILNCKPTPFEEETLNIHNRYRAIHNAPAMTLNCEMSKNASEYAQKLASLDSLVNSEYNERREQGENLSLGCNEDREETAEEAIKLWFDEVCDYVFGQEGPQSSTNHFTQLVWKGSTELGIGKAINKQSNGATCTFIVARYKPNGNLVDDDHAYVRNVEKGVFDDSYCRNVKSAAGLDGGYGV